MTSESDAIVNHSVEIVQSALKSRPPLLKILLAILVCLLLFLFYHPKLLNLRFGLGRHRETVDLHYVSDFYLWNRKIPDDPQRLVIGPNELIVSSYFRPIKTYIIIHGFTGTGRDNWIDRMKDAFLWREDCNVISTNWRAGFATVGYYVIQERVPYVASDISKLIHFLAKETGLELADIHVIGHSLGAHIAGYTGKLFDGDLERITGLDPASVAFNGQVSQFRLDKTDAKFVDVIHTHGCFSFMQQLTDCFGTYCNVGHADFWPNGGEYQPACDEGGDGHTLVRAGSNCHHGLAYAYYTESIYTYATSTIFMARKCDTWTEFNNKSCDCTWPPQYMGHNADSRVHGVFYLNTSKLSPYGLREPYCWPTQLSWLKVFGIFVCLLLTLYGSLLPFRKKLFSNENKGKKL